MEALAIYNENSSEQTISYEVLFPSIYDAGTKDFAISRYEEPIDFAEFVDVQFDEESSIDSRVDYSLAAASGLLTGALSVIWTSKIDLKEARSNGARYAERAVIAVAKSTGYAKDDLTGAIRFLEKKFPLAADKLTPEFGGGLQHHLRDFCHHPSPMGLVFSILSQFLGCGFGTDTAGRFVHPPLPAGAPVGKNIPEMILFGTINWVLHLVSDMAGSSSSPGKGTGIPGPILSMLKEISSLPFFNGVKLDYVDGKGDEKVISLSQWISKLFNGTAIRDEEGNPIPFDLRTEMGVAVQIGKQALPVVANECIVRAFYLLSRLHSEMKAKKVTSIADIRRIDTAAVIPFNNREVTRMCTIASGTFVAVNLAGSAVKAAVASKGNKEQFAKNFIIRINYVGIGRFAIACAVDAKYIADDIKSAYRRYHEEKQERIRAARLEREAFAKEFSFLTLDDGQTRILQSLKYHSALHDALGTKKYSVKSRKLQWIYEWEQMTLAALQAEKDYILKDEADVYALIESEMLAAPNDAWLRLATLELIVFQLYTPLGGEDNKDYKSLKSQSNYAYDVFAKKQDHIVASDLKEIEKTYQHFAGQLKGTKAKIAVAATVTAIAAVASGGAAFAFAPQIAVLIAGEAVAGLSGAALTSASLAFVGGGALAAGGLGMAGGTAILTGGGALLGLAASGTASLTTALTNMSEAYVLSETTKLLTFCKCVALDRYNQVEAVQGASRRIETCIDVLEGRLDAAKKAKGRDKTDVNQKQLKASLKCFTKCKNELDGMTKTAMEGKKSILPWRR